MQHVNGVIESEPHFANSIHGQTNMDMQIFANCTIDFIIKNLNELDERGNVAILLLMDKGKSFVCVEVRDPDSG